MSQLMKPARQPVNLTLTGNLVRRARLLTPNLSEKVELLLSAWVEAEESRQMQEWAKASDAFVDRHGLAGADHSPV